MDDVTLQISPDLALVDPVLARAARAALADPPDCLAPRERAQRPTEPSLDRVSTVPVPRDRRAALPSRIERIVVVALSIVLVAVAIVPFLAFIPPGESSKPRILSVDTTAPTVLKPAPKHLTPRPLASGVAASQVEASDATLLGDRITIRWSTAPRQPAFYNLVLFVDGRRVDAWPTSNTLTYAPPPGQGRDLRPTGIRYRWYVYPGYRGKNAVRFGPLIATGSAVSKQPAP